jgi:dolichol-phosphate mannosyltransferase
MSIKTSIIIPTYNEVDNIVPLVKQISEQLSGEMYEMIVVDDDSPDGTSAKVTETMKDIKELRLITRTSDRGLVPSINEGLASASGEICLWMDADLTMSPALIPSFIKAIDDGADLVLGSRYIPGGGIKGSSGDGRTSFLTIWKNLILSEDSFLSAMMSKFGNGLLPMILDNRVHDYSSGFFALNKKVLNTLKIEGDFLDYCLSLPYQALKKGLNVVEIPMVLATRKYGQSKTSSSIGQIISIAFTCFKKAILLRLHYSSTKKDHNGK